MPKTAFTNATGESPNTADIKADLIAYVTDYREGNTGQGRYWSDEYYNGCGLESGEYTKSYEKMLKSVYDNKGFYIGKYEVGIKENTVRSYGTDYSTEHSTTGQTPVIQANKYPYNWVRCSQAQTLSATLATGEKTSSLMFGIQWDLVMRYLEVKGKKSVADLKTNSASLGNYKNGRFNLTTGSYSKDNGANWTVAPYNKTSDESVLLTTGSIPANSCMNVYDIAGNVWEWTLEHATSYSNDPCAHRGGGYDYGGSNFPASYRGGNYTTYSHNLIGFRSTLY